ncbi:MAG: Nif3-like dinuclear metal center hexameric protein [Ignavibacteriaceae bacterium]|nr:Nif3-like dinuclear metal center hexameric protein [Ignavibacteriaceae bacterium]
MRILEITKTLDEWAPQQVAWERDNPGIQVGYPGTELTNTLICMDVSDSVIEEAIKRKCNLIISHHPLLFLPLKRITPETDRISRYISKLLKHNITLFSYHTNLDYTKHGVSFQLAKKLQLEGINFLEPLQGGLSKFVVFSPESDVEKVSEAIFGAGGGVIGEYSNCSTRNEIKGTFKGSNNSNPTLGAKNVFETVKEIRLEAVVYDWLIPSVIERVKKVHSYEEPAFEVYKLQNSHTNFGAGAKGTLKNEMSTSGFLSFVSKSLNAECLRYGFNPPAKIKKVAVMGGAGQDYLNKAISEGCNAFITGDIGYHRFQDSENKILLIDAGHFETEVSVLDEIRERIISAKGFNKNDNMVFVAGSNAFNPVKYYNKRSGE